MKCISRALLLFSLSLCLGAEAADPPGLPGRLPGKLPGQQPPAAAKAAPAIGAAAPLAAQPRDQEPCCGVTAVDMRTGMVTAREISSGRTFQFKVANPAQLRGLKVGQAVAADFRTGKVSVRPAGAEPVNGIVVNPAEPVGQGMSSTASAATAGSKKTKTTGGGLPPLPTPDLKVPEGDTAMAIRGAAPSSGGQVGSGATATSQAASAQEPADEDAQDDPEPVEKPKPRAVAMKLPTMRAGAKGTKLTEYADAQKMLDEIAKGISAKEIDVALVGGEKYKINKCLGVKASAGTFKLKFASPNARIEGSGARLTFRINSVSINALKLRMKPNASNPLKLCHWSKKFTVGGAATNITYELRFDPILDLEQCKLGSLGIVKHRLDIGGLNLKPLQNDLDRAAKNMIEDAYNNAANLNMNDRIIASSNAFLGVKCKK